MDLTIRHGYRYAIDSIGVARRFHRTLGGNVLFSGTKVVPSEENHRVDVEPGAFSIQGVLIENETTQTLYVPTNNTGSDVFYLIVPEYDHMVETVVDGLSTFESQADIVVIAEESFTESDHSLVLARIKRKSGVSTITESDIQMLSHPVKNASDIPRTNYEATSEPGANNDASQGYTVGSTWIFNGTTFQCLDSTEGAAVWEPISRKANLSNEAEPGVNNDASQGYQVGSEWFYNGHWYKCYDASEGAAVWKRVGSSAVPKVVTDLPADAEALGVYFKEV